MLFSLYVSVVLYFTDRSYPTHTNFMGDSVEAVEGRASLFRVLATYARYNRTVEYCQGVLWGHGKNSYYPG